MTHNSTATTPHNSDTNHNEQHLQSMTPESRVKDLGGTVVHYKFYTCARFTERTEGEYFYQWLRSKDNYEVVSFNTYVTAYRHKTVSPQKN